MDLCRFRALIHVGGILAPVAEFSDNVLHSGNTYMFTLGRHGNIIPLLGNFALEVIC